MNDPRTPTRRVDPAEIFMRGAIAHLQSSANNDVGSPTHYLEARHGEDLATRSFLALRSAVNPIMTTDSAWAITLANDAVARFVTSLSDFSAASRLIAQGARISLAGAATVQIPRRQGAVGATPFVLEGAAVPDVSLPIENVTLGPMKKMSAIVVVTREIAQNSANESFIRQMLRENTANALDQAIFSSVAASATRPAGILNGVSATTAAAAGADALVTDLENLAGAVGANVSRLIFVAHPRQALSARLRLGADRMPDMWASAAIPPGTVIALDASAFASAFDSVPQFAASTEAVIHADTAPADISSAGTPNVVAAPTRSLFQTDCTGLRVILPCAWVMRSAGAVAWMAGATWGAQP